MTVRFARPTVTYRQYYTRCCINTIRPPDDEHSVARNMYSIIIINVLYNVIVHQVGHLPRVAPWCTVSRTWNSRYSTCNRQNFRFSCVIISVIFRLLLLGTFRYIDERFSRNVADHPGTRCIYHSVTAILPEVT